MDFFTYIHTRILGSATSLYSHISCMISYILKIYYKILNVHWDQFDEQRLRFLKINLLYMYIFQIS